MNYKEFNEALSLKGTLIFGKQTLVLNSAKNKYEYNEEEKINALNIIHNSLQGNNEEKKSLNSSQISNITQPLSSAETGISSVRNSKEFITNNSLNENFDDIQSQIKNSLKKLSEQYYQNDNKPSLFNYYCSPFIYNPQKGKESFNSNKYIENLDYNYNDNLFINCPFESCK